jgi:hypothetical protein
MLKMKRSVLRMLLQTMRSVMVQQMNLDQAAAAAAAAAVTDAWSMA